MGNIFYIFLKTSLNRNNAVDLFLVTIMIAAYTIHRLKNAK